MISDPNEAKAARRRRTWPCVALALLAGLAVIGLAAWVVVGVAATSELRKAEAEADRLDPGWRFREVLARRAEIAPSKNSAGTMRRALGAMRGPFPTYPKVRRGPTGAPFPSRRHVIERMEKIPADERFDDALAAAICRDLRRHRDAVPIARSLSQARMGRTDPNYQFLLWGTLLGHVQRSREVARLLQADSAILAHDGRADAALDDCRAMIGVERSIGDEPFYISQLVRVAILNNALVAAERVLNQGEASDSALVRLQALLLEEADDPVALLGVRGERAMMDDVFAKLTTGQATVKQMNGVGANAQSTPTEILTSMSTAFVRHNHAIALNRMNEAVEIAKRPLAEQPDLWDEWEKQSTPSDGVMAQVASALSREAVPAINAFSNACIRSRVQCFAMILLIAAERHRLAHGAFPATIAAIDPKLVPRAFVDPYSGKPLVAHVAKPVLG